MGGGKEGLNGIMLFEALTNIAGVGISCLRIHSSLSGVLIKLI